MQDITPKDLKINMFTNPNSFQIVIGQRVKLKLEIFTN